MSVLRRRRYPFTLQPLPAGALTASAGDDQSLGVGVTTAMLVGSAAGGQGPYTHEWSVVSGAATFDDAASASTTATITSSPAVLRLTVHDVTRTVATDDVAVDMPPAFLDTLATQPLWASWLGGRLSAGQTRVLRVRRSTGGEQDIGLVGALVDLDALATFCGTGVGYLVTPYNAVDNAYTDMPAPADSQQAIIYSFAPLGEIASGPNPEDVVTHVTGPVLGANGYLAAYFDGGVDDPDPNVGLETGDDIYLRDDALGMTGDATFTLLCDVHTKDLGWMVFTPMTIGKYHPDTVSEKYTSLTLYSLFIPDPDPDRSRGEYNTLFWPGGPTDYHDVQEDGYPPSHWIQATHQAAPGTKFELRANGTVRSVYFSDADYAHNLNMTAPLFVSWGGYPAYDDYTTYDTIPGISSAFFVWNAVLSSNAADQTAVDTWISARRA